MKIIDYIAKLEINIFNTEQQIDKGNFLLADEFHFQGVLNFVNLPYSLRERYVERMYENSQKIQEGLEE